jgi:hypothetical protein
MSLEVLMMCPSNTSTYRNGRATPLGWNLMWWWFKSFKIMKLPVLGGKYSREWFLGSTHVTHKLFLQFKWLKIFKNITAGCIVVWQRCETFILGCRLCIVEFTSEHCRYWDRAARGVDVSATSSGSTVVTETSCRNSSQRKGGKIRGNSGWFRKRLLSCVETAN